MGADPKNDDDEFDVEDGSIDPEIAEHMSAAVSRQLRDEYRQLTSQPIPDRFRDLLDRLSNSGDDNARNAPDTNTRDSGGGDLER